MPVTARPRVPPSSLQPAWIVSRLEVQDALQDQIGLDVDGPHPGSIPGFANLARVTIPEMEHALERLTSPDPYGRITDNEGRRIEKVPGGWRILNYLLYRDGLQDKPGSKAKAMREHRGRIGNALPRVTSPASASASAYQGEKSNRRIEDWAGPVSEDEP